MGGKEERRGEERQGDEGRVVSGAERHRIQYGGTATSSKFKIPIAGDRRVINLTSTW